ncbi:tRNA (adenosine(37)-N6)-threonylcarbamoyltransferase complex dimerization subunit type 1 TsaB [Neobacillus notoginsengisoli]|uniref:tRNA (Adenosine(37)-N6)-threonylcarbamoyltransferase complex dimerization subunit type 1 TsaB n=1 Tax=Neobacillus notoginsengisoli TaxID=1578198 RepID=A0A417YFH6_9BACI|nr:tRNA (adenosine(37)-N6)-threonylcarbamoyltransferase complex dimerization subunit type 1 TsaB [Neobacillus notoginsengisoli]RHW31519.1 tRNA (adenosine(37)-N6)-threonylcarbamoyltransferase complex dimerization subunit type 1 TsaB [Neobacillus notoginsengisoli]
MKILAIDTSNYPLGVAVTDGDRVIAEYMTNLKRNHSLRIMPAIETALKEAELEPSDLKKIVVAEGPGSYTGVRIGVTIAKTMAWTLGIPLVGVSSLEVLAMPGRYFAGTIAPIFDARRGQVYTGLYTFDNGQISAVEPDQLTMLEEWAAMLANRGDRTLFIGNDVALHKEKIEAIMGDKAVFASPAEMNPRPSELAFLGRNKQEAKVHSFVPNYIRLAEAEAKWLEARGGSHE